MTDHMIEVAKRNKHKSENELREYLKGAFWQDKEIENICKYVNRHFREEQ